jgi:hypothetical protein
LIGDRAAFAAFRTPSVSYFTVTAAFPHDTPAEEKKRLGAARMTEPADADLCEVCKRGKVKTCEEKLSFQQKTRKGYVFCEVIVPTRTCESCGTKSWDEAAEAMIDEAVRKAYDQLP